MAEAPDIGSIRMGWGLSQAQFAHLFMTSVRTVKRWETRQAEPDDHERWFLGLFGRYVQQHGLGKFRERFVRPGPSARLNEPFWGPDLRAGAGDLPAFRRPGPK